MCIQKNSEHAVTHLCVRDLKAMWGKGLRSITTRTEQTIPHIKNCNIYGAMEFERRAKTVFLTQMTAKCSISVVYREQRTYKVVNVRFAPLKKIGIFRASDVRVHPGALIIF